MGNCARPATETHKHIELYDNQTQDAGGAYPATLGKFDYQLNIRARISKKESAGIYDYEAKKFEEKGFTVNSSNGTLIISKENELQLVPIKTSLPLSSDYKSLLTFQRIPSGGFVIKPEHAITSELGMWMIIRSNENRYQLKQGDVIKLGRTLFRIKQISPNCQNDKLLAALKVKERANTEKIDLLSHHSLDMEELAEHDYMTKEPGDEQASVDTVCRICYDKAVSTDNPLISLCKCTGSLRIEHRNKTYHLMDLEEPKENFMMLEMFTKDKDSVEYAIKGLYIIKMNPTKAVTIGRGRSSSIMISEISVSRTHCKIGMSGNKFFLEDHDSKFGTLVSLNQGIIINPEEVLELQINQIFITMSFSRNPSSSTWLCCGVHPVNESEVVNMDPANFIDTQEVRADHENQSRLQ